MRRVLAPAVMLACLAVTCTTPPAPPSSPTPCFRHNTPLHDAALGNDLPTVRTLLANGASVDATNDDGATALHLATGSLAIVQTLLAAGAKVDARTTSGMTPLLIAAARESSHAVVHELLQRGADPTATSKDVFGNARSVLEIAAGAGDLATVRLLLPLGAEGRRGERATAALNSALSLGSAAMVEQLLAAGADPNGNRGFHSLNAALYGGHTELALLLMERGADLERRAGAATVLPPIVWAAYNEDGNDTVVQRMLARGVDVDNLASNGESARRWAEKRGPTRLTRLLRERGAVDAGPVRKRKAGERALPTDPAARGELLRSSVQKALTTLQHASDGFLANGFVQKSACVSCHHQTLPAVAFGRARQRGYQIDEASLARQLAAQAQSWERGIASAYELNEPQPDSPSNLGYGLLGLHALGHRHDELSEAMAWYLVESQRDDGSWASGDRRPPMEEGRLIGTALAVGALRTMPPLRSAHDLGEVMARARGWLDRQQATSRNAQLFQLLGLGWAGAGPAELERRAQVVVALQQSHGGFAPFADVPADPWTTALAVFALRECGLQQRHAAVIRRADDWLLRTQLDDGSWWQESRTWPLQPHFDSGFPHGKDQWIAAGATALAALVLLEEEPPTLAAEQFPSAQELIARHPPAPSTGEPASATVGAAVDGPTFAADILPILKTSCIECHSGDDPKGGLSLDTREGVLAGGNSNEPAVVPGKPEQSPLLRFVADQVEDLEMPPLRKRERFPRLDGAQIETLRAWVRGGAR